MKFMLNVTSSTGNRVWLIAWQDLAPLVFMFEVPATSQRIIAAPLPSAVQAIQRHYGVSVTIRSEQKPSPAAGMPDSSTRQSVIVRGSMNNVNTIVEASASLYELLTGQCSVSLHCYHFAAHFELLTGQCSVSLHCYHCAAHYKHLMEQCSVSLHCYQCAAHYEHLTGQCLVSLHC